MWNQYFLGQNNYPVFGPDDHFCNTLAGVLLRLWGRAGGSRLRSGLAEKAKQLRVIKEWGYSIARVGPYVVYLVQSRSENMRIFKT